MLVQMAVDGQPSTSIQATIRLVAPEETIYAWRDKRFKEGDLRIDGDYFCFAFGRRGAFVLGFAALKEISVFTISFNDQPLLPVNLRDAAFRSF